MYKIIVFGNLPIATRIAEDVIENKNLDLVGVVVGNKKPSNNDPWKDTPTLFDFSVKNNIKMYTLNELDEEFYDNELDLGLSCRFNKIIPKSIINKFSKGIINMHGGLLPEFAGLYSCNHTILSGSKVGGGTLHYIDEGIDTGNVIKRCEFKVEDSDTGFTVFQKTQLVLEKELKALIPVAVKAKIDTSVKYDSSDFCYYDKNSINDKKEIKFEEMNKETIERTIRAFDFPGFEPAFFFDSNGRKIYLRYSF